MTGASEIPPIPTSPFPGIESFRYVDRAVFFAREEEVEQLVRAVVVYRGMLLYGDSGCGKSSLVNAAFLPRMLACDFIPHLLRVQPVPDAEILVERIATSRDGRGPFLPSIFTDDDQNPERTVLTVEEFRRKLAAFRQPSLGERIVRNSYERSLAIREKLATDDPANTRWQRYLALTYEKKGDVGVAQGDLPNGLSSYKKSLQIREKLAAHDPADAQCQRDLSVSYNKIGDVQKTRRDLSASFSSYEKSLKIREKLVAHDPTNSQWQRHLSVNHEKIAIVQSVQSDLDNSFNSYKNSYRAAAQAIRTPDLQSTELLGQTVATYQSALETTQDIFLSYYNRVSQDVTLPDMWQAFPGAETFFPK
jgi:tetratricopeptide (TPR) repeat protein